MTTRISVLLADDHCILRTGLRSLIDQQADMKIVGEAEGGRMAIKMARELTPSVVVMDIMLPDLNGIDATRQIIAENRGTKVIALTACSDHRSISNALMAGAVGFLPKTSTFEELIAAIRAAAGGKAYLSPRIADLVLQDYLRADVPQLPSAFTVLTPRERETLQLIAQGFSTKEVAYELKISIKTIETHRARMKEKLKVNSVALLTKYAIREGLTSLAG